MEKFENAFRSLDDLLYKNIAPSTETYDEKYINEGIESLNTTIDDELKELKLKAVYETIARYMGENKFHGTGIGTHPDFLELESEKKSNIALRGYVATLFIDMVGSTKLSYQFRHDLKKAIVVKRYVINYAIAIIQSFGGYVHRIMGDAVLAFFRKKENVGLKEVDSCIDAVNCASYLIRFMELSVIDKIKNQINTDGFGIRVGIEYGGEKDILWSNYGINGSHEVTATSFYVDVASKLQQAANTNEILIGKNIRRLIGFDFNTTRTLGRKFLKFDLDSSYTGFILKREYIDSLPVDGLKKTSSNTINIKAEVDGEEYFTFSKSIEINKKITFTATMLSAPKQKNTYFKFTRVNTGTDSRTHNNYGESKEPIEVPAIEISEGVYQAEHTENSMYVGMHHMNVSAIQKLSYVKKNKIKNVDDANFYLFVRLDK